MALGDTNLKLKAALDDVPEEYPDSPQFAYPVSSFNSPTMSTGPSLANVPPQAPSRKASSKTVGAASITATGASKDSSSVRAPRKLSSASTSTVKVAQDGRDKDGKDAGTPTEKAPFRRKSTPQLHKHNAEPAPPTLMYWSRAPVYGTVPIRKIRAHSATMVDNVAWYFGGCDEQNCWRDVWCLDTETMEWSFPTLLGDIPEKCRAHTATLVDRKIFFFGGGSGHVYFNDLYVLDTVTRRWSRISFPKDAPQPIPRRAHTAVLHRGRLVVFGGGNGTNALNDVWVLDVTPSLAHGVASGNAPEDYCWRQLKTHGKKPAPRGYHTANLIGDVMVVVGGSDGKASYNDIWCLNLDSNTWSVVKTEKAYRRLAHTSTQVGSYLFIMGGHDGSKYLSDLLLFNLVSLQFEPRATLGRPPQSRGYHATVLADGRLFVFGGFNGQEVFDDLYILDLAAAAYLPQVTSFKINVE